jgi:MoxR-like ATPase
LGAVYRSTPAIVNAVNAAILLRRPLLVTGSPGSGKSSLAEAVAHELSLRPVVRWHITSRTTLQDGLYHYDAIARLQDTNLRGGGQTEKPPDSGGRTEKSPDIGNYLRLGPLGTALATPSKQRPRVLLIDELDKSDIDLPNDLLHVFEEGSFRIPEVERLPTIQAKDVRVRFVDEGLLDDDRPADDPDRRSVAAPDGWVRCGEFPIVIFTSNGEREFPPAFLRRCLRLHLEDPTFEQLEEIVAWHLGKAALRPDTRQLISAFVQARQQGEILATDQLLNAIQLVTTVRPTDVTPEDVQRIVDEIILKPLTGV